MKFRGYPAPPTIADHMFPRVIALLLVLVLLWTGFSTHEQATSLAAESAEEAWAGAPQAAGSVEDHHLDDLPAQAHVEHLADVPTLGAQRATLIEPGLATTRLRTYAEAVAPPPYLGGPQRPPCATAVIA